MAVSTNNSVSGQYTTDRGTKIVKSNTDFDKNSFLKILAAQLSNLDPTQNQDSSAYVAQMAQFASLEQMQNLNGTMSDYAYQQMIGKTVTINSTDDSGKNLQGYVTGIIKKASGTYADMIVGGKSVELDVSNIIGVVDATDSNTVANSRSALNSDFLAASALAQGNENVVVAILDDDGKTVTVKGKVTGAYIDTVSGATVKIKVATLDDGGKPTGETKTYDYGDIVRAGNLSDDDMNVDLGKNSSSDSSDSKDGSDGKAAESSSSADDSNANSVNQSSSSNDKSVNTIASSTNS
ncbi:flagellar hook capping protein [Clostridium sp. DL-VIII]|uniref:flagellar hook assembly protein FlgD n=1 Tax=Clostridium sp. DL-VIII TaxID=641107 RepID=UPI00023B05D8|nr:flagellar hook capping FlgD N-terminal domain-containing protein [Clostridium sp. DL-VIII]EHJ01478.1 flagellar hook capping protein [Clostridium sp. DL-VIII]